jgi:deferrochelatase/peroxidase EfeB
VTGDPKGIQRPVDRRGLLRAGAAGALGGAAVGATFGPGLRAAPAAADGDSTPAEPIPFHGLHQPGVTREVVASAAYVACDLTAKGHRELVGLMKTLTDRARFLCTGGRPLDVGIGSPPSDSGVLGPELPADGLTVTVSVGASLFDERFGLHGKRPRRLTTMGTFPDDDLDADLCHGDLMLMIAAPHPDTVLHALRDLLRHTRGALQPRWRVDAFGSPPRPSGTPRNLMGFMDGSANPTPDEYDGLVWVGSREPAWTAGGSYQVVRVIRMFVEFWDRVGISEQERMIGRRRDTGAPLSGSVETDAPDYGNDPIGSTTPLDAHIRMANPRTPATDRSRMLRRAYNYDRGLDVNGDLEMGLMFTAYMSDLERAFVTVQKRLEGEPLVDYISPIGGGYFFALPGVRDAADWYGQRLLSGVG